MQKYSPSRPSSLPTGHSPHLHPFRSLMQSVGLFPLTQNTFCERNLAHLLYEGQVGHIHCSMYLPTLLTSVICMVDDYMRGT